MEGRRRTGTMALNSRQGDFAAMLPFLAAQMRCPVPAGPLRLNVVLEGHESLLIVAYPETTVENFVEQIEKQLNLSDQRVSTIYRNGFRVPSDYAIGDVFADDEVVNVRLCGEEGQKRVKKATAASEKQTPLKAPPSESALKAAHAKDSKPQGEGAAVTDLQSKTTEEGTQHAEKIQLPLTNLKAGELVKSQAEESAAGAKQQGGMRKGRPRKVKDSCTDKVDSEQAGKKSKTKQSREAVKVEAKPVTEVKAQVNEVARLPLPAELPTKIKEKEVVQTQPKEQKKPVRKPKEATEGESDEEQFFRDLMEARLKQKQKKQKESENLAKKGRNGHANKPNLQSSDEEIGNSLRCKTETTEKDEESQ